MYRIFKQKYKIRTKNKFITQNLNFKTQTSVYSHIFHILKFFAVFIYNFRNFQNFGLEFTSVEA